MRYAEKYLFYIIFLLLFSLTAFIHPLYTEIFDRFHVNSIKREYGLIRSETAFYDRIVLGLHIILIGITFFAYFKSNKKALKAPNFQRYYISVYTAALAVLLLTIPSFLFGRGSGFYWTQPLFFCIIPFFVKPSYRKYFFLLILPITVLSGSKQNIVYLVLVYFLLSEKVGIKFLLISIPVGIIGMYATLMVREEAQFWGIIWQVIFLREYSMEVTGAALYYISNPSEEYGASALLMEITANVPHFLVGVKDQPGHYFIPKVLPADYQALAGLRSGTYRSLFFPWIIDFGWPGIALALAFYYAIMVRCFESIRKYEHHCVGFVCLFFTHFLINGEYSFTILYGSFLLLVPGILFVFDSVLRGKLSIPNYLNMKIKL